MSHRRTKRKGQMCSLGHQANWTEQYGIKVKMGTQAETERKDRDEWRNEIRELDGRQSNPEVDNDFWKQSEIALTIKVGLP